jgi:hypothetical protein
MAANMADIGHVTLIGVYNMICDGLLVFRRHLQVIFVTRKSNWAILGYFEAHSAKTVHHTITCQLTYFFVWIIGTYL